MTYNCPAWKFAADTHFMKLQRLNNKLLCPTGKFTRRTSTHELSVTFNISTYTALSQIYEARKEMYKWLKSDGGQAYTPSAN
jgi:hypothetical protein